MRANAATARDPVGAPARVRLRRKGYIDSSWLALVIAIGCVPLVFALARVLALPGAEGAPAFGTQWLYELGRVLNQSFTLRWVPPDDRVAVLYLLSLPTGALLVAIARLTLGLRVLGLRAILIAIAFQEIGFLASLGLMIVVIGAIAALRPSMKRIRLPMYARLPVILCVAATIMVCGLLLGPWVRSETVFNVAFFPAIIMAMLAEGIGKTLATDNALVAAWRLAWTIVLAIVLAVLGQTRFVAALALEFPELLVTQLVAIVLIAEFLDLRLLEHWPARLSRLLSGVRAWYPEKPRVAVVRNRATAGVIGQLGLAAPRRYRKRSVQPLVDALREQGFAVRVLEGDRNLPRELLEFLPPDALTGAPGGLVLNVATGLQGVGRFCHVPALLEMLGIAYTGPDPLTHARLIDRHALLGELRHAGLRVPRFALASATNLAAVFEFPLAVRPRCEPDAAAAVVFDAAALEAAVRDVVAHYEQDALVEEVIEGREVWAPLLGNETVESLPLLEHLPDERREVCPAQIDDDDASAVRACAYKAYRALGCRDYAQVAVRLGAAGGPVVVDVRWAGLLDPRASMSRSAEVAGLPFRELVSRVIEEASLRYPLAAAARAAAGVAEFRPPRATRELLGSGTTVGGTP